MSEVWRKLSELVVSTCRRQLQTPVTLISERSSFRSYIDGTLADLSTDGTEDDEGFVVIPHHALIPVKFRMEMPSVIGPLFSPPLHVMFRQTATQPFHGELAFLEAIQSVTCPSPYAVLCLANCGHIYTYRVSSGVVLVLVVCATPVTISDDGADYKSHFLDCPGRSSFGCGSSTTWCQSLLKYVPGRLIPKAMYARHRKLDKSAQYLEGPAWTLQGDVDLTIERSFAESSGDSKDEEPNERDPQPIFGTDVDDQCNMVTSLHLKDETAALENMLHDLMYLCSAVTQQIMSFSSNPQNLMALLTNSILLSRLAQTWVIDDSTRTHPKMWPYWITSFLVMLEDELHRIDAIWQAAWNGLLSRGVDASLSPIQDLGLVTQSGNEWKEGVKQSEHGMPNEGSHVVINANSASSSITGFRQLANHAQTCCTGVNKSRDSGLINGTSQWEGQMLQLGKDTPNAGDELESIYNMDMIILLFVSSLHGPRSPATPNPYSTR
ncbi:hypothetical protein EV401DRAFT_1895524 [Pisolithus croceorrhizus]|nr:hypothetical protein EV401DRAFT_1895524 [Pisolithus croceorrhizus]